MPKHDSAFLRSEEQFDFHSASATDFAYYLNSLKKEKKFRVAFTDAIEQGWPEKHIKKVADFNEILGIPRLSPKRKEIAYTALKTQMLTIINNAEDFSAVHLHLNDKQFKELWNKTLVNKHDTLVKNITDFAKVFSSLAGKHKSKQRQIVYNSLKDRIPLLINTIDDLYEVFCQLSAKECKEILKISARQPSPTPIIKSLSYATLKEDTLLSLLMEKITLAGAAGAGADEAAAVAAAGRLDKLFFELPDVERALVVAKAFGLTGQQLALIKKSYTVTATAAVKQAMSNDSVIRDSSPEEGKRYESIAPPTTTLSFFGSGSSSDNKNEEDKAFDTLASERWSRSNHSARG